MMRSPRSQFATMTTCDSGVGETKPAGGVMLSVVVPVDAAVNVAAALFCPRRKSSGEAPRRRPAGSRRRWSPKCRLAAIGCGRHRRRNDGGH